MFSSKPFSFKLETHDSESAMFPRWPELPELLSDVIIKSLFGIFPRIKSVSSSLTFCILEVFCSAIIPIDVEPSRTTDT